MNYEIQVLRVENEAQRQMALEVMRATYRDEKNWVGDDEKLVARADLRSHAISWFVALADKIPVGVLRVLYEPPLDLYRAYGFKVVDQSLDLDAFIRENRIAEVGRFAVLPEYRRNVLVVVGLMREAAGETVARGYTHYVTDVFEGEQHSPYDFHRRVMGFQLVATHEKGELNCANRRLTMILDIRAAYQRLYRTQKWVFRHLTEGWNPHLHELLAEPAARYSRVATSLAALWMV
jgi:hypothetical protein